MRNEKYKILVLSDLKENSKYALRYAVQLAKEIDANIECLHAKGISDITQIEDPLSAMNVIREVYNTMEIKLDEFIKPVIKDTDVKIKSTFVYGNIKNEIENHIIKSQPDMIILGERLPRKLKFLGDNITRLVERSFKGVIFIADDNNTLDANGNISLDNLGLKNNIAKYKIKQEKEVRV
jgi:nucleotide-binding universal stress UspA family protein